MKRGVLLISFIYPFGWTHDHGSGQELSPFLDEVDSRGDWGHAHAVLSCPPSQTISWWWDLSHREPGQAHGPPIRGSHPNISPRAFLGSDLPFEDDKVFVLQVEQCFLDFFVAGPLSSYKLVRIPKRFCLSGLYQYFSYKIEVRSANNGPWAKSRPLLFFSKQSFLGPQRSPFVCVLSMAALPAHWQSWLVAGEAGWPVKLKIFINSAFIKEFANPRYKN